MNQDGYTLTEMLAALLMIGLAVVGLAQAVRLLGSAQATVSDRLREAQALRAAEGNLSAMLSEGGPYRSSDRTFAGDSASMTFACDAPAPCSAALKGAGGDTELRLRQGESERAFLIPAPDARFVYESDTSSQIWPPNGPRQVLRAVHLVSASEEPVFTSRVWAEQPAECAFDSISRDCREATP